MRTALDADPEQLDQHERNFVAKIRLYGWFATHVGAGEAGPNFSYTTGFWKTLAFPEVVIFAFRKDIAHQVLRDVFDDVKAGRKLNEGERTPDVLSNLDVCFLKVDKKHYQEHLGWSRWFYGGNDFPCLQLVWPDLANLFPWQAGFDPEMLSDQPDLSSDQSTMFNRQS